MKGIIINEGSPLLENKYVNACYIKNADLTIQLSQGEGTIYNLSGAKDKSANACCSKNDTYDFETGALIALMKMCGLEKSAKAYAEIFDDTAYGDALIERDKLKEKVDTLYAYNKGLIEEIDQQNHEIISLKALKLTNESLKKDNESFRKACENLKEENSNLKTQISVMAEKETELIDSNKRLSNKSETLNDALNTWKQRYLDLNNKNGELVVENYKLKTDCEKLQHGYIDTDMIFCSGRSCGKQYKALVNLFKRLPQDKIEAAYKEVYNTELPAWKKEFLNQMYSIYKESREKTELPRTLDINGTVYRKSIQIKDFGEQITKLAEESSTKPAFTIDGFIIKNKVKNDNLLSLTKREKMWDYILKEGRTPVYVERKDIHKFLEECQIAGVKWQSGKMPLEAEPFDMIEGNDGIYFFVMTSRTLNGFRHVMTWWTKAYDEDIKKTINYLPPMRWDLFKKGRLVVRCKDNEVDEFETAFENSEGPWYNFEKPLRRGGTYFYRYNKSTYWVEIIHQLRPGEEILDDAGKINGKKIVDWEDVR